MCNCIRDSCLEHLHGTLRALLTIFLHDLNTGPDKYKPPFMADKEGDVSKCVATMLDKVNTQK